MTQRRDRFPAFGLMLHDMGNSYFSFKQFTVSQARSAMRVGTDGVLLGAWCDLGFSAEIMVAEGAEQTPWRILDVGTGTGVVALMAAQRVQHAQVDAVEPDEGSCLDAAQNFAGSRPFAAVPHNLAGIRRFGSGYGPLRPDCLQPALFCRFAPVARSGP